MPTHVAPRRDFHGLEVRRKQAARLFAAGRETQGAIARRLGVSRQSVMRWYQAWRSGGREALRAAGRAGRKPRLAPEQLTRVDTALREGPRAHGFSTGLDPAARRTGDQARDRCEVSPGACLAPLGRARLDAATSSQTREGAERDRNPALGDDALARGKKNARRRRAWIIFQDESGVSQRPPVRRTWAPRGETPVLIHAFNWAKPSLAVGLAFRWDFRRSGLFFQTRPGSYNDVTLIGFLNELKRHLGGRRLT